MYYSNNKTEEPVLYQYRSAYQADSTDDIFILKMKELRSTHNLSEEF
jgi:hypothetical protein